MAKIEITEEMLDAIEAVKGRRKQITGIILVKDIWKNKKLIKKM